MLRYANVRIKKIKDVWIKKCVIIKRFQYKKFEEDHILFQYFISGYTIVQKKKKIKKRKYYSDVSCYCLN